MFLLLHNRENKPTRIKLSGVSHLQEQLGFEGRRIGMCIRSVIYYCFLEKKEGMLMLRAVLTADD